MSVTATAIATAAGGTIISFLTGLGAVAAPIAGAAAAAGPIATLGTAVAAPAALGSLGAAATGGAAVAGSPHATAGVQNGINDAFNNIATGSADLVNGLGVPGVPYIDVG